MNQKTLIIIACSIIAIILVGSGVLWYQNSFKPQPSVVENTNTPTQPAEPVTSGQIIPPTKTDCADELVIYNWKTYQNTKYQFQFKYPNILQNVSAYDGSILSLNGNENGLLLVHSDDNKKYSIDITIDENGVFDDQGCDTGCKNISVNNHLFVHINHSDTYDMYVTKINNGIMTIFISGDCKDQLIAETMMSFKVF